jgi:hypothetical protein
MRGQTSSRLPVQNSMPQLHQPSDSAPFTAADPQTARDGGPKHSVLKRDSHPEAATALSFGTAKSAVGLPAGLPRSLKRRRCRRNPNGNLAYGLF